jgi:RNA polymerase sigma factor (sigma-70 family)
MIGAIESPLSVFGSDFGRRHEQRIANVVIDGRATNGCAAANGCAVSDTTEWARDAELLARWRAGDNRAGSEIYDRHAPSVARFFQNKLPDLCEEMMQQTFLALVESRDRIQAGVTLRAFVLSIARHKLLDHLRKLSGGRHDVDELGSVAALAPGASTIVAQKREQRLLLEGLRRIPIEHQTALELFYWEGLNANEIAAVFGISHSAMRSRLSKARALLEQAMAEVASTPELLASTVSGLDDWAAQIREKL